MHAEAFYGALARMFNVREANIELLNDASSEYTLGVKLHFQVRAPSLLCPLSVSVEASIRLPRPTISAPTKTVGYD